MPVGDLAYFVTGSLSPATASEIEQSLYDADSAPSHRRATRSAMRLSAKKGDDRADRIVAEANATELAGELRTMLTSCGRTAFSC
ncbi:MAG: hypothetical protein F4Y99_12755 [Acidimicrobiaceae bacterium]|nr:hypothetical protein [Acidimicrobiaceae bacterium]MDE0517190.1 hypothetical protein [Acidimicrobiaceae bacterium]MDE0657327.1 hypothetical protein [Acidimicrobiaceae bacterium]MXZ96784.1 hypothetical protein [Acidimicrobiaceae bacterium]MYF43064.1 hypothetical protein [Acidimicrobiaceae bacterium]